MNSPKIRFKGYTEDWEQRKLGDVTVKIGSGKTPSGGKNVYVDAGIPLIRSQNVNDNKVDFEDIVYIDESTDKLMMNSRVFANDVLLNITGASIGRSAVYKGLDEANVNQHVCIIRPIEGYHPDFIQLNLASDRGQKQIKSSQAGGGREGLNFQQIGKMKFVFPTLDEQKQIGNYFNNIDHLITLHQRKCEQTKTLKKYMLQKMFPQEGQKVPEIRFEGFTSDWEQRKLSEFSEKTFGGGTPKTSNESFWKGNIPWIQSSDLIEGSLFDVEPRKYISQEAVDKSATKLVPENSVAIVTRVGVGKLAFMPFSYATSQDFLSLSVLKTEPQFTVYALYKKLQLELNTVQGTSIKGVTKDELLTKEIMIPCYEEQEKIGSCLHSLDRLITLHQREYEKLQELKKFMLQNMFV